METATLSCSQASLDVGEPIFATAPEKIDLWLLLEHDAQWASQVLETPTLPARVVTWVEAFLADNPGACPLLIRQPDRPCDAPRSCFVVRSSEVDPAVWRIQVDDLEALADFDLNGLLAEPGAHPELRWEHPLFLVCTHGKRDACCARYGPAVQRALTADRGEEVWQASHIGGHRFAPTFACLPHGHYFGRADGSAARRIAGGYAAGRLTDLLHYRGRATYARPVQAAEYFVRQELGIYGIEALHYSRGEIAGHERWRVCFVERDSGDTHELTLTRETSGDVASPGCGKPPKPVKRFVLESHRQF